MSPPEPPPVIAPHPIQLLGEILELEIAPGEAAWLRRSSLIRASGEFDLTTHRISRRTFNLFAVFSGDVRWANKFSAGGGGPVTVAATRDYPGQVAAIEVSPDRPLVLQPNRYLGHRGDLAFDVRRVAKKEFWTMAEVTGTGTVYVKLPGEGRIQPLTPGGEIVDTNYVTAVSGSFKAFGKVFTGSEVVKSGELSNVRLSGEGYYLLQSHNPEEMAGGGGGGGIFGFIGDLLPF